MLGINGIIFTLIFFLINGCFLSRSKQKEEKPAHKQVQFYDRLPHPDRTDLAAIQHLLAHNPQPTKEDIDACMVRLTSLAAAATNEKLMLSIKEDLIDETVFNYRNFHWCYYQWQRDMDLKLADGTRSFEEKSQTFLVTMKSLWLLGMALQDATDDEAYFIFLRDRYVQISHDVFGRTVSILAPPL